MQKQHKKIWRRILVAAGCIVATPIVLFLLLAILIYIPPVQNFAVRKVAAGLSESLGMSVGVERVRLAFPLDLAVHNVLATCAPCASACPCARCFRGASTWTALRFTMLK